MANRNKVPMKASAPLTGARKRKYDEEQKAKNLKRMMEERERNTPKLGRRDPRSRPLGESQVSLPETIISRLPSGVQDVARPVISGLGSAGTTLAKAADLPNRLFGNTRSRLQDFYEKADRNIAKFRVKDPSTAQQVIEAVAGVGPLGVTGKALPVVFGASAGTDMVSAAEAAGAEDAQLRGAKTVARETALWSAGVNLATRVLPPHLKWLGSYVTGVAVSKTSAEMSARDYADLGYDVDPEEASERAGRMAMLLPFAMAGVKELSKASYRTPDGRSVSLAPFAQRFQSRVKQADRTPEDAKRIATEYVDMVEAEPGKFITPVSPEGKALQRFTGLLVQPMKNGEKVGQPRLLDPKGRTGADAEAYANDDVKSWYGLYQRVIGEDGLKEIRELSDKLLPYSQRKARRQAESKERKERARRGEPVKKPSPEEQEAAKRDDQEAKPLHDRLAELITAPARDERRIQLRMGDEYINQSPKELLEQVAQEDTDQRIRSLQTLATFLKGAQHYAPEEKAMVLSMASQYAVRNSEDGRQLVTIDSSNIQQPTVVGDGQIAAVVDALRSGVSPKKAMLAEPKKADALIGKRGVPVDYTGWKRFDRSNDPKDIEALTAACAGSKGQWCTGSGAAGGQLPYGDFHVHFTNGEPDVAIRMTGNQVDEVRGSDTGQRLFPKEAETAEAYIREQQASGYKMDIDEGFWADQAFRRKLAADNVTWKDVWEIDPEKPSFAGAAGEMGAEDAWPPYAQEVIRKTLKNSRAERHQAGYFTVDEIPRGSVNPNVRHIKGSGLVLSDEPGFISPVNFPNLETVDRRTTIRITNPATELPKKLTSIGGNLDLREGASAPGVTSVGGNLNLREDASAPGVTSVGGNLILRRGASAPGVTSVGGDLTLGKGASAPGVTSVGWDLIIVEGASAPGVTSVGGDLILTEGASAPERLTSVGGNLDLDEGASAPKGLTSVGRDLILREGASAPGVTSVGGDLILREGASAPGVTSVGRDLILYRGVSAPEGLTSVGGNLDLDEGASAPGVTSVGGYLNLAEGASAPGVTSVGGNLNLRRGASAPGVTSVGGNLNLRRGASAPGVTSVGGNLNLYEGASAPGVTSVGGYLNLAEGASAPEGLTSVGWVPFNNERFSNITPKYGYIWGSTVVNKEGIPLSPSDYERDPANLPDYVRPLYDPFTWRHMDQHSQMRVIRDLTDGFHPNDENERDWYRNWDDDLPFALKAGRTRRDIRAAEGAGDTEGPNMPAEEPVPQATEPVPEGGPRIVINPEVFEDKRDALCVAMNEAFRILMEMNGFNPVSEPTDTQRQFFSDTAYSQNENQMRRTILARICTFDTSVKDPTEEQLAESVEFLETVMEMGAPQNEWEQQAVQRIHDVLVAALEQGTVPGGEAPAEEPVGPT